MKPVFKCDYCSLMGDEEQVKAHEPTCMDNYDRRSCRTCAHKQFNSLKGYKCDCGIDIPEGKIYEFCKSYEYKGKPKYDIGDIFAPFFGGLCK